MKQKPCCHPIVACLSVPHRQLHLPTAQQVSWGLPSQTVGSMGMFGYTAGGPGGGDVGAGGGDGEGDPGDFGLAEVTADLGEIVVRDMMAG